ncbi:glycosyltransferase SypN [Vibrio ponticus]|nr:glycosyltransferase SypN [Vibrio ponticus]
MSDVLLFADPNNPSTNGLIAMMKSLRDVERIIWVKLHTTHFSSASDGTRNLMSAANAHSSREKFGKLSVDITLDLHIPNTIESEKARCHVQQSLMRELVPALSFLGIENPIIWASDHRMADVCAALTQRNLIYYCAQEFPIATTTGQSIAFDQHRKLIEQADVVFASHEQLSPTLPKSKTFLLTQGSI